MKATRLAGFASAFVITSAVCAAPAAMAADTSGAAAAGTGQLAGTYAGFGSGMNNAVATTDKQLKAAVQYKLDVGGQKVTAYCVQFNVDVDKTGAYTSTPWASSGVKNLGKVADIVTRHATMGTPLEDPRFEAAAVQAAVWAETGDIALDALQVPDPTYRNRATALMAAAADTPEPSSSITLTADAAPADGGAAIAAKVAGNTGPQAGVPVKASTTSGVAEATTGTDGVASLAMPGTGGVPADVAATVTFAPGVLMAPGSGQVMVLAEPVTVQRNTSVALAAVPAATPVPTASPVASPVPSTSAPATDAPSASVVAEPTTAASASPSAATSLPNTGSSSAPWMVGVALLAAAGGAGLFVWSRLRPSHRN